MPVDADHITAIDNVTRKLMQAGKRPVADGHFFSLGHSRIVALASTAVATASAFKDQIEEYHAIGGVIGTCVSATVLLIIALANLAILRRIYRIFQEVRKVGSSPTRAWKTCWQGAVMTRDDATSRSPTEVPMPSYRSAGTGAPGMRTALQPRPGTRSCAQPDALAGRSGNDGPIISPKSDRSSDELPEAFR